MSKILIAVGGTGQEIGLSCLRLCHMADIEPPVVVVVDSDQGSAIAGIPTRTDKIQEFATSLKEARAKDFVIFLKPIAENIRERQVETLRSLFSPARVTPPAVQDILSFLFTVDQQETRIVDGFHGKPTVGSVAVTDYMLQPDFREEFLNQIDTLTKPQEPHFIAVAGSTTGGTGPGTIPPLSHEISEWRKLLKPERRIELSGVVQLQWFHPLEDKEVSWSRPPDVDLVRLQQNSACLVRQYEADLARLVDRLVLISLPRIVRRVSAGPNHQPEALHWLNVLSGWISTELLYAGQTLNNLQRGIHAYALDEDTSPLDLLSLWRNEKEIHLRRALNATRVVAAFGKALKNQIEHGRLDPALPRNTFGFLQALRSSERGKSRISDFLDAFLRLTAIDKATINWFRDACASRFRLGDPNSPRDENDIEKAFRILPQDTSTGVESGGKLLKEPQNHEHDFVDFLLRESHAHVEPAGPQATAVTLYRDLRKVLLERLL